MVGLARVLIAALFTLPAAAFTPNALAQGIAIPGTSGPGKWFLLQQMPVAQNEAATAVLDGKVYVIAGFEPNDGVRGDAPTTRVQVYDTANNTWSAGVPVPEPLHHAGAAVVDGKIYLVGGFHKPFQQREPIDSVWMFDPAQKIWTKRAPLPAPRGALLVATVGDKIYAIGGEHYRPKGAPVPTGAPAAYEPLADAAVYDPRTDIWQALPPMKVARDHAFVGAIDGKVYVVGGRDRPKYDITTLEAFDPATRTWSERAPIPTGRSGGNAAVVAGMLYVFGGEGKTDNPLGIYDEAEVYAAATNAWTKLGPMPFPRHSLSAATVGNRIYLPGGAPHRSGYDVLAYLDAYQP